MNPAPRRSPLGALALVLALAALVLAGWSLWSGLQAREQAASRAELQRLRAGMDSLRALVPPPDTARLAGADTSAAPAGTPTTRTPTSP